MKKKINLSFKDNLPVVFVDDKKAGVIEFNRTYKTQTSDSIGKNQATIEVFAVNKTNEMQRLSIVYDFISQKCIKHDTLPLTSKNT